MRHLTNGARLLLIEDDPDNLEVLSEILGWKYEVSGHSSPAAAVKEIAAVKPDLLVMDIGIGPPNGVECLKTIRAMPGCLDVPAVALTGFARDVERQGFLAAGFQAVFAKPLSDPYELLAAIDTLLECPAPLRPTTDERTEDASPSGPGAVSDLDDPRSPTQCGARGFGKNAEREPA